MRISLVLGGASALLIVLLLGRAVVHLDLGLWLQGAQCLVAADDDFVAGLQTLGDFDIRAPCDAGFNWAKQSLFSIDHEHSLDFVLFRNTNGSSRHPCPLHFQITLLP